MGGEESGRGGGGSGVARCEQRSEVFVKIRKKKFGGLGGVGGGGQVGVFGGGGGGVTGWM